MAEKSARRLQLEASLLADPGDTFLRYGVALQCLREGDTDEGRRRLHELVGDHPTEVAAYQQLGQSYLETGEAEEARTILQAGIQQARKLGQAHAAAEMAGLLDLAGGA